MFVDDEASQPEAPNELAEMNAPDTPDTPDAPDAPDELTLARELVLRAHPETVHELIAGGTLAELLASVPAAEAAFARVAESTRATTPHPPASVPGGGAVRSAAVNLEGMGPLAKIRQDSTSPDDNHMLSVQR